MIYYILWGLSFVGLVLGIFWLSILFINTKRKISPRKLPFVSIIVPAHNEEKTIGKTINSILNLDYPIKKIEIILVNDESRDKTVEIAKRYKQVKIINNKHRGIGKASAVNSGLRVAKGEFFGIVDADSEVSRNSLKKMMGYFSSRRTGAVISAIKVSNSGRLYTKLQKLEYSFTALARELMSRIDTLHFSHGVLSVFRTDVIKDLGYFDENNLTEDLEIAMRLKAHHYNIIMAPNAITYTNVPATFKSLWNQRIRWYRGLIHNLKKYKGIIFNPKYGFFGTFQIPINIITLVSIVLLFVLFIYQLITFIWNYAYKIYLLKFGIFSGFEIPSIKFWLLNFDVKFLFPIIIAILINIFFLYKAHKIIGEKVKFFNFLLVFYFMLYPIITMFHWIVAIFQEMAHTRKKW